MQLGTRSLGFNKSLSEDASLTIGKNFVAEIQTSGGGLMNPKAVADYILSRMHNEFPELVVTYISVCPTSEKIRIEFRRVSRKSLGFTPRMTQLSAGTVAVYIAGILPVLGLAIVAIAIFMLLGSVPWYVWGMFGIGAILLVFGKPLGKMLTPK